MADMETRGERRTVEYYLYCIVGALLETGREPNEIRQGIKTFAESFGIKTFPIPPDDTGGG